MAVVIALQYMFDSCRRQLSGSLLYRFNLTKFIQKYHFPVEFFKVYDINKILQACYWTPSLYFD